MGDNTYWMNTRADLLLLVERLQPDDALDVVRALVRNVSDETQLAPTLAGMVRGLVARRDDEQKRGGRNAR